MARKSSLLLPLSLALLTCCAAGKMKDDAEDEYGHDAEKTVDPTEPMRADIVCRARCLAKCLSNNTMVSIHNFISFQFKHNGNNRREQ